MIWIDLQDLPVDLLSGLQTPGLMVLERNRECFGKGGHWRNDPADARTN
jgi:hypothetical protein